MRHIQLGVEGGCSTPENPVRPAILDQELAALAIVCAAHPLGEGTVISLKEDSSIQEQVDDFCTNCPLNRNRPPRNTPSFLH